MIKWIFRRFPDNHFGGLDIPRQSLTENFSFSLFGPCLLWPNGWMDQDATRYGGRPWPRPHSVRWGCTSLPQKGHSSPPLFGPYLLWPNTRLSQLLLSTCFDK